MRAREREGLSFIPDPIGASGASHVRALLAPSPAPSMLVVRTSPWRVYLRARGSEGAGGVAGAPLLIPDPREAKRARGRASRGGCNVLESEVAAERRERAAERGRGLGALGRAQQLVEDVVVGEGTFCGERERSLTW